MLLHQQSGLKGNAGRDGLPNCNVTSCALFGSQKVFTARRRQHDQGERGSQSMSLRSSSHWKIEGRSSVHQRWMRQRRRRLDFLQISRETSPDSEVLEFREKLPGSRQTPIFSCVCSTLLRSVSYFKSFRHRSPKMFYFSGFTHCLCQTPYFPMKIASDANFGILRFWHFAVAQSAKSWIEPVAAARSSRAVGLQRPSRVPFRISWTWSRPKSFLLQGLRMVALEILKVPL